jgi:glycerate-2-kinase
MRRSLLFVTCQNDDGLSYAIELARTLDKDLSILLIQSPATESDASAAAPGKNGNGGIKTEIISSEKEFLPAIREALKQLNVETVLLGATVTGNERLSSRELNRILKSATTQVVTIAKPAKSA